MLAIGIDRIIRPVRVEGHAILGSHFSWCRKCALSPLCPKVSKCSANVLYVICANIYNRNLHDSRDCSCLYWVLTFAKPDANNFPGILFIISSMPRIVRGDVDRQRSTRRLASSFIIPRCDFDAIWFQSLRRTKQKLRIRNGEKIWKINARCEPKEWWRAKQSRNSSYEFIASGESIFGCRFIAVKRAVGTKKNDSNIHSFFNGKALNIGLFETNLIRTVRFSLSI